MIQRDKVKDWTGRVIGTIETDSATGDKTVKDFYGRVLGKYIKKLNVTKDFYGRVIAKGDQSSMLFSMQKK